MQQSEQIGPHPNVPLCDAGTWAIIKSFAGVDDTTLSVVETRLKDHLGTHYNFDDWGLAFDAVFQAEDDTSAVLISINTLELDTLHTAQVSTASSNVQPPPPNNLQIVKTD